MKLHSAAVVEKHCKGSLTEPIEYDGCVESLVASKVRTHTAVDLEKRRYRDQSELLDLVRNLNSHTEDVDSRSPFHPYTVEVLAQVCSRKLLEKRDEHHVQLHWLDLSFRNLVQLRERNLHC